MSDMGSDDHGFMRLVFRLARRGSGSTSPNPMVGAVVVKAGEIVGQGYHRRFGGPHAEVFALNQAGERARGATLYVNLEPCNHFGKTPPCVERVIEAGIAEVVISNSDPNPLVNGGGIRRLQQAGIRVRMPILAEEGYRLNEAYFTFVRYKRPFVILKWAQSVDGRIATRCGDSTWISNERSRRFAHRLRRDVDAVLVGAGTVRQDNPRLTVRHVKGKQPWRLVLDRELEIDPHVHLLQDQFASRSVIFTCNQDRKKIAAIREKGAEVVVIKRVADGSADLRQITAWMADRKLISLLVEGGNEVLTSFLKAGLVDKLLIFTAPKLLGEGLPAIGDLGVRAIHEAKKLDQVRIHRLGTDLLWEAYWNGEPCSPD